MTAAVREPLRWRAENVATSHAGTPAPVVDASGGPRPRWVRAFEALALALMVPSALACVLMVLQIIVDVAGRTFFHRPLRGTLDMTSDWWMVAMVFLALGYAQMRNEHIRATVVTELMPQAWQRGAEMVTVALVALLAIAMAYYGWSAAVDSYAIRESSDNVRTLPLWPFRFLVPLGCLGLAVQCIVTIHDAAAGWQRDHEGTLI